MLHIMKLDSEPFEMIVAKSKTIELRLNDEKRQQIKIGDIISFVNNGNSINCKVIDLFYFANFKELYDNLPLMECGYKEENIVTANSKDMDTYYSIEKQKKYGVVGIKIAVLS